MSWRTSGSVPKGAGLTGCPPAAFPTRRSRGHRTVVRPGRPRLSSSCRRRALRKRCGREVRNARSVAVRGARPSEFKVTPDRHRTPGCDGPSGSTGRDDVLRVLRRVHPSARESSGTPRWRRAAASFYNSQNTAGGPSCSPSQAMRAAKEGRLEVQGGVRPDRLCAAAPSRSTRARLGVGNLP